MKTRAYLQFRRTQSSYLAAKIQKRPWQDEPAPKQSQGATADFSHVDLFSHAPVRTPIQIQLKQDAPDCPSQPAEDRAAQSEISLAAPATSSLQQRNHQDELKISPLSQTPAQIDGSVPIQRFSDPAPDNRPADVKAQGAFNPKDILHKLLIAIDQSDAYMAGGTTFQPVLKRKVDFATVVRVLSNLTVVESQAVQAAYFDHENRRTLKQDLFGTGESGFESDLNESQRAQIRALLAGTRAEGGASEAEQQAATIHVGSAQAAEMQRLLHGDLGKADIDRIMAILRQSQAANASLDAAYKRLTGTSLEIGRLKPIDAMRASMLLTGSVAAADTFNVSLLKSRIATIDQEVKVINEAIAKSHELSLENMLSSQVSGDVMRQIKLQQLRKERQQLVEEIQQRGEQVAAEAQTKGESVKERVGAVFGDVEGLTQQVKGSDAVGIRAIAQDDPVAKVVAQLRKAKEADTLSAAKLAAAMRGLRTEAEERARRMLPSGDPGVESQAVSLADEYFARLRTEYNALVPKGGDSFDEIINETGNKGDETLNQSLWVNAGRLEEVEELVLALNGDRKDTESVERVLRNKNAIEIQSLKNQYLFRTGKSLDFDLFGQAPTTAGEENPQSGNYYLKTQGKAKGTSRLNLEDYMQRPSVEGGLEEMLYTLARAEREYEFTVENRGVTGWWRDTWGNEQRALLDETITEMRQLKTSYLNLVGWMPVTNTVLRPEAAKSGAAKAILQKLRLARHTIRGDRAAYEKATAELRETFTAIASFVIQAALTALLTPAAGALFKGVMAARGVMAVRMIKWVETLAVNAASSVGGNLMAQGSDYSLAMLKADLLGAIGGQLGSDTIEKMLGPVAKGLAARLGDKCSAEITAFAKTIGNVEGGAWAQGNEGDLSLQNLVKTHLMGKGSEVVTKGVTSAAGLEPTSPTSGTGSKESGSAEPDAIVKPPAGVGSTAHDDPHNAAHAPGSSQSESSQPAPAETKSASEPASKPGSETIVQPPAARPPGTKGKANPEQFHTMSHEQLLDIFTRATRRPGPGHEVFEVYASREAYDDSYRNLTKDEFGSLPLGFVKDGVIHLPPNASVLTVLHESLHWASKQSHAREILGGFVEEGITEALARRIGGPEVDQIYESNVAFVAELTGVVGEKMLDQAFLHRQWGALRNQLASHLGGEAQVSEFYDLLRRIGPGGSPPEAIARARRILQRLPDEPTLPDIVVPEDLADSEPTSSKSAPLQERSPGPEKAATHSMKSPGAGSQSGMMGSGPPSGTVLQAHDPHDLPSAYLLYKKLIAADPQREVSLLYNHKADQWAIVQGDGNSVNVHQAMQDKGWEVHETTSARHSHPTGLDNQTPEYNQFPSGRGGDLSIMEATAAGRGESRWHAIDITTAAGPDRTWVMRTKEGLWTVDYPDLAERGGRGRVSFTSMDQYQNWFQNRFGFSPDRAGSPALSAIVPPTQPTHTGSHLDQLAQAVQVPVLTGLSLGPTQLQSGGDAGSLSAHGSEFGALPTTLVDGTPIVVKVYPRTPHLEIPFTHEVRGLAAAEALDGPKLYGLVYIDDTKLAVAMEQIPGGFPTTFSTAPADIAEAARHGANVHAGTVQDVETYGQRLWNAGHYALGDVQGFVDDVGHWRPIDLQSVRKRTGAPDELLTHQDSIKGLVKELQDVINQRPSP